MHAQPMQMQPMLSPPPQQQQQQQQYMQTDCNPQHEEFIPNPAVQQMLHNESYRPEHAAMIVVDYRLQMMEELDRELRNEEDRGPVISHGMCVGGPTLYCKHVPQGHEGEVVSRMKSLGAYIGTRRVVSADGSSGMLVRYQTREEAISVVRRGPIHLSNGTVVAVEWPRADASLIPDTFSFIRASFPHHRPVIVVRGLPPCINRMIIRRDALRFGTVIDITFGEGGIAYIEFDTHSACIDYYNNMHGGLVEGCQITVLWQNARR